MVKHFRELLVYREAFESAVQIFETQAFFDELDAAYEKVSGGLVNMMANADQWCISSKQVREGGVEPKASHTHTLTHPQTRGEQAIRHKYLMKC